MHRSVLTGIFIFALSASSVGIGGAAESTAAPPVTQAADVAARSGSDPAPAVATPSITQTATTAGDAAGPTADADIVVGNASFLATTQAAPLHVKHDSRLRRFASGIISRSSAIASSLTRSAMRFIGTPYVFGGTRTSGFDCSGYVQHVFATLGVHLPRTADAQYDSGHRIFAEMAPGDLVFFHTYAPGVSHVGIYLGHNRFIHSSSSRGVSVASLHDSYWAPRYLGAKRVVGF